MSPVHQDWPKPSCKAQWRGEEDKADRGRGGKTTSGNGQAWSSAGPRGQWKTGKMEKTGCEIICGAPTTFAMTTSHKSQAFSMVCHRVLCLAQFSSACTQNLFLTWFSVTIEYLSFADDTQLQVSIPPSNIQSAISSLETCLSNIRTWTLLNKLKLNNDKTEALLLRTSSKSFSASKPTTISVCCCEISFSSSARNLGFYIRDDMSVELHIKSVCQSAYTELRRISTIRHLLSVDSTKTLVSAFVLSRLDYCNSLLSGYPTHLEKLQKVQNSAARLVLKGS